MTLHGNPASATAFELRHATAADAGACGRMMYTAFRRINENRGFRPERLTIEAAAGFARSITADPQIYGVVAAVDGKVGGSNFLTEGDPIRGVGRPTVDPDHQGAGLGRRLMQTVIDRGATGRGPPAGSGRLQHRLAVALRCARLAVRKPLVVMAGRPRDGGPATASMQHENITEADAFCRRFTGFSRRADIGSAVAAGSPVALRRSGRLVGYMTAPGFWIGNRAVAETEDDLRSLTIAPVPMTSRSPS